MRSRHPRISSTCLGLVALIGLGLAGTASAVPCGGPITNGGIVPTVGCQDGPIGDASASAAELSGFFGVSSWTLLDSTEDGVNTAYWSFTPSDPNGRLAGIFTLAADIWSSFSQLTVVLAGPPDTDRQCTGGLFNRTCTTVVVPSVQWSAYELKPNFLNSYAWGYGQFQPLTVAALFGAGGSVVSVSEPAALALFALACAAGLLMLRRKGLI